MVENAIAPGEEAPPVWRHMLVTVVIALLVCGLSMATDCLGIVLELNVSIELSSLLVSQICFKSNGACYSCLELPFSFKLSKITLFL